MGMTFVAFLLVLTLVIFVHEYGHYRTALHFRVRVLRFSMGFGRPLWRWHRLQPGVGLPTEFTVCAIPLGGFIKMLDEREQVVDEIESPFAFNRQTLFVRALIVVAGPLANVLLSLTLYACLQWMGSFQPAAVIATPAKGSIAESSGLLSGDRILKFSTKNDDWQSVQSMDHLKWLMATAVNDQENFELEIASASTGISRTVAIVGFSDDVDHKQFAAFQIGLNRPFAKPELTQIVKNGPADKAGLLPGDLVLKVDDHVVNDAQHLIQMIRGASSTQLWEVRRGKGENIFIRLYPERRMIEGVPVGKIDAAVGGEPEMVWVQPSLLTGLAMAFETVMIQSKMTFQAVGKLVTTASGWQQLSGPLTMAEYAGKTAALGWRSYAQFIAVVSLSIGLLNLLPIPMLDGGHLMYYLWESVFGNPPSQIWQERLQVLGISMLVLMMFMALFNDVFRLST